MSKLDSNAKHAIDQMLAARKYIKAETSAHKDVEPVWEAYVMLMHALYTPQESYQMIAHPDPLKKPEDA